MKLFIAGTAGDKELILRNFPKYILESFFYIKDWQIELIKKCDMFLLDSGAFSFIASKKKHNINWEEYVNKYADFINKHNVKYFFELDIDSIVGLKEVERLRNILEKKTNRKCIPVWHINRGKDYFIKMCKEYDYVAFGGIITDGVSNKTILKYLPWFTKTAHQHNCKIHALGLTCNGIETYGVDSSDSTTWLQARRFGELSKFDGKKMVRIKKNSKTKKGKPEILEYNLKEWIKYQEYLDR